jgi:ATP-dependent Lhr-like helicase
MVYESRVGDVFVLGASSWRIEDITPDRVLVSPAPGQPGRLPFWHGDSPGRPAELGRALGAFTRELAALEPPGAHARLTATGLDEWAAGNLVSYLSEQREATRHIPDDRTLVVERFRDELGDWRLVVHSPYGALVHAPWALAITGRLRERYGMDSQAMHSDDGIVLRIPDTDAFDGSVSTPTADLVMFDPEEIERVVVEELGSSALFAARFRECAARSLLLPRRRPDRRQPLWQQRQRAAQLLSVASKYSSFPIVLETMRECLQDVFDVPGLVTLMRDLAGRKTRLVEVETPAASPFARSLLFRYIGAFMYEGDAPLAERRAQALALDSSLLAELLGQADLRELLDPEVVEQAARELQRLTPDRQARDLEGVADLLRTLGPLTTRDATARLAAPSPPDATGTPSRPATPDTLPIGDDRPPRASEGEGASQDIHPGRPHPQEGASGRARPEPPTADDNRETTSGAETPVPGESDVRAGRMLAELEGTRRAIRVRIAGVERWAAIEDAGRLRDALGVPLPIGIPEAFLEQADDPLGDLISRYARTHVPFRAADCAFHFGLGTAVVTETLRRLATAGRVVEGEFLPVGELDGPPTSEWCDAGVLRMLRRRSLARLRAEVEPSPPEALGRFLPAWHGITSSRLHGMDALLQAIDQLQGAAIPASALESLVLPARVPGYSPALLDELTSAGEVLWVGRGGLPGGDGWMSLYLADTAPLLMPEPGELTRTPTHDKLLDALSGGGALFFRTLSDQVNSDGSRISDQDLAAALWDLLWAGLITNDTLAPLRATLGSGRPAHRSRSTARRGRPVMPSRTGPPTVAGRWWTLPERETDRTRRGHALAETLLERYGVVIRGAVAAEHAPGGFAAVYPVLKAYEETGRCRRGYFVEGLGAAQFALPGAVDRLRALAAPAQDGQTRALVLAAADPANPYGAALPWPERPDEAISSHKPGRKAGALVVLVDGDLLLYVERGGRTLLSWTDEADRLQPAVDALALAVREGALGKLTVERADGESITDSPLATALEAAGFHPTPRGLRLRS